MELNELIEKIDIKEYIGQFIDLEEKNGEWWGISPFTYPPENTPSFSIRREKGAFKDFSSGIGGNVFTFIKLYHKVGAVEAVKMMKQYLGLGENDEFVDGRAPRLEATSICTRFKPRKCAEKKCKSEFFQSDAMDKYEWREDKLSEWEKEGISYDTMRHFNVRYDSFSDRIVYPITDLGGNIVNIGGRTLNPSYKELGLRKYTYFSGWGGGMNVVYGLFENLEDILRKNEVIIFEGVKSVMIAREWGIKNCGAILTSHLNPMQADILMRLGVHVVFALDKEICARDDRNIQKLSRYATVEYIWDFRNRLKPKDAPVDEGFEVFTELYNERIRMK